MTDHAGNIIPLRFVLKLLPPSFQQDVIVNWLELEVPQHALHGLEAMRGWRNREVHAFIAAYDWTAAMFPHPVKFEHERPSRMFVHMHNPHRHVPIVSRKS